MRILLVGADAVDSKEVLSFTNDGHVVVKDGDKTTRHKLFVMPGGGIAALPEQPKETPIDQLVMKTPTPIAHRHRGVDQIGS